MLIDLQSMRRALLTQSLKAKALEKSGKSNEIALLNIVRAKCHIELALQCIENAIFATAYDNSSDSTNETN